MVSDLILQALSIRVLFLTRDEINICSIDYYEDMCKVLVEDGIDQCRLALNKILKRHKLDGLNIISARDIDDMDCGFDTLQLQIEEVLRDIRLTSDSFENLVDSQSYQSHDEPGLPYLETKKFRARRLESVTVDPHPFASRKRFKRRTHENGRRRTRSEESKRVEGRLMDTSCAKRNGNRQGGRIESYAVRQGKNHSRNRLKSSTLSSFKNRAGRESLSMYPRFTDSASTSAHGDCESIHPSLLSSHTQENVGQEHKNPSVGKVRSIPSIRNKVDKSRPSKTGSRGESVSRDLVFNVLKDSSPVDTVNELYRLGSDLMSIDVDRICNLLVKQFFVTTIREEICTILPTYFREMQSKRYSIISASKLVLRAIFTLIQENVTTSFSEMISCKDKVLVPCLQLFTCLFNLTSLNIQSYLEDSDEQVYTVLKVKKQETIELVLLQIIDILYSQALPDEWGNPDPIRPLLVHEVSRLSMALGKNVPLVETVSRLVMVKFGCQCWYQGSRGDYKIDYVSAINPSYLRLFWSDDGKIKISS